MLKSTLLIIIACATAATVTVGVAVVFLLDSGDGPGDTPGDSDDGKNYVGQYLRYETSGFFGLGYNGWLRIEITGINAAGDQLEYTVSYNVRAIGGIQYSGTEKMWLPLTEDPLTSIYLSEGGLSKTTRSQNLNTIHGRTTPTDIYTGSFFDMNVTAYIGKNNGIVYRVVTPIEGITVTWDLARTNLPR